MGQKAQIVALDCCIRALGRKMQPEETCKLKWNSTLQKMYLVAASSYSSILEHNELNNNRIANSMQTKSQVGLIGFKSIV